MNKKHLKYIFLNLLMTALFSGAVSAQNLSQHLWENRIILIYTEDETSKEYKQQLDELGKDTEGLDERKLVIYSITPDHVKKGLDSGDWKKRNNSLDDIINSSKNFEVLLLGLDGRVKLRQDSLLTNRKLFNTIDAMPMRQNELRK